MILDLIGPLAPTTPIEIERDFENFYLKHNDHNSKEERPLKGFRERLKTNMYRMDQTFEFCSGLANKMEYLGTGVLF